MEIGALLDKIENDFTSHYVDGIADMENKKRRIIALINKHYPHTKKKLFKKEINQTSFSDQFVWDYILYGRRDAKLFKKYGPDIIRYTSDLFQYDQKKHRMCFGIITHIDCIVLRKEID